MTLPNKRAPHARVPQRTLRVPQRTLRVPQRTLRVPQRTLRVCQEGHVSQRARAVIAKRFQNLGSQDSISTNLLQSNYPDEELLNILLWIPNLYWPILFSSLSKEERHDLFTSIQQAYHQHPCTRTYHKDTKRYWILIETSDDITHPLHIDLFQQWHEILNNTLGTKSDTSESNDPFVMRIAPLYEVRIAPLYEDRLSNTIEFDECYQLWKHRIVSVCE
jgi:hypothetical protein